MNYPCQPFLFGAQLSFHVQFPTEKSLIQFQLQLMIYKTAWISVTTVTK